MLELEFDFEEAPPPAGRYTESNHPQGSDEWHQDRLAIPTASGFSKIITSGGKSSDQAKAYMYQLLADWKAGYPVDYWGGNKHLSNGKEREPEARALYSFITDSEVREVGFCRLIDIDAGASPDGFVGDDGMTEFKCPKGSTLIEYMLADKLPSAYFHQVQGGLWVTGRKWCDFFAWHPDVGHFLKRVERDEPFIANLEAAVIKFNSVMFEYRERLAS